MHTDKKMPLSKRTAIGGILASAAIALSFAESLIPSVELFPAGAKLGFSNIAVMAAVFTLSLGDAFAVILIKSGFVLLTRGLSAAFMSFAGGLLSFAVLSAAVTVSKKTKCGFSYFAVSVICAVSHNIGQCAAASIYMSTNLVTSYLPVLIIFGIFSGAVTGILLSIIMPAVNKATARFGGKPDRH